MRQQKDTFLHPFSTISLKPIANERSIPQNEAGGIRKPRTYKKNRRMLHIYSIAVRPDKNDMAIEPEGMDRKERGSKEGGREILQMEQILNVKLKPLTLFRLLSFSPTSENPFSPSHDLPNCWLFFFVLFSPTGQNHSFSSLIPLCMVLSHSSSMANRYTSTPCLSYSLFLTPASSLQQHPPDSTKFLYTSTSQMSFCLAGF